MKSRINLKDFENLPLRKVLDHPSNLESQVNILLTDEKKTKVRLIAVKNGTSITGIVGKLIDLLIEEAESKNII